MTREQILNEAEKCVTGQREQDYGKAEDNFAMIAELWEVYIRHACTVDNKEVFISGKDVAVMMSLLKVARIVGGGGTGDSFVDACGYIACAGEMSET